MTPFELLEPDTLLEATQLLDPTDPTVRPIAGGTALMLMMKSGLFRPTRLVSLRRIDEGTQITVAPDGALHIGALTPLTDMERSAAIARIAPVITRTLRTLSNVRIRNVATLGGHLAHGDPHMDLPPVLIALDAQIRTVSPSGGRTIAAADLFTGYYETILARNELIAEVIVPPQTRAAAAYVKCTTLSADDWPTLGVAVSVQQPAGTLSDVRLVISAVTEKATRLIAAERLIAGATPDEALFARAGEAAADEIAVSGDARGSAPYKLQLVRVYVARALRAALHAGNTN